MNSPSRSNSVTKSPPCDVEEDTLGCRILQSPSSSSSTSSPLSLPATSLLAPSPTAEQSHLPVSFSLVLDLNETKECPEHFQQLIDWIQPLLVIQPLHAFHSIGSTYNAKSICWRSLLNLDSTIIPKLKYTFAYSTNTKDAVVKEKKNNELEFTYFEIRPFNPLDTLVTKKRGSFPKFQLDPLLIQQHKDNQVPIHALGELEALLDCTLDHLHPSKFRSKEHTGNLSALASHGISSSRQAKSSKSGPHSPRERLLPSPSTSAAKSVQSRADAAFHSPRATIPTPAGVSEAPLKIFSESFEPVIRLAQLTYSQKFRPTLISNTSKRRNGSKSRDS